MDILRKLLEVVGLVYSDKQLLAIVEVHKAKAKPGQSVNCLNCADFDDAEDDDRIGYCLNEANTVADRAAGYAGHFTGEESWCPQWNPSDEVKPSRGPPVDEPPPPEGWTRYVVDGGRPHP